MRSTTLTSKIKAALEDKKAEKISILDVHNLTSVCDHMIIASANSSQHIRALANQVVEVAKKQGIEVLGVEGEKNWEWVLIDLGNILVHVMLPETRSYYELEKLWSVKED